MKKQIKILTLSLIAILSSILLSAQNPNTILLNAELSDIDENPIVESTLMVTTQLLCNGETISSQEMTTLTNDKGEFLVHLKDIDQLFIDQHKTSKAEIKLSIKSDDSWLETESFSVNYYLHFNPENEDSQTSIYEMNRFEGQKLTCLKHKNLYKFSDTYSFAYLKASFILSTNNEYSDPNALLKEFCDLENNATQDSTKVKSRGVKGSFAVGGYKKN